MITSRRFWTLFAFAWLILAFVPCIPLMKLDVQIGWLMLAHVYIATLSGDADWSWWPWIAGHVAAALVVASVIAVIRGVRQPPTT